MYSIFIADPLAISLAVAHIAMTLPIDCDIVQQQLEH